jgi:hypothetical protein
MCTKLRSDREKRAGEEEGGDDEALDLDPKSQNVCRVYCNAGYMV